MTASEQLLAAFDILTHLRTGEMLTAAGLLKSAAAALPGLPASELMTLQEQVKLGLELASAAAAFYEAKLALAEDSPGEEQPRLSLSC